MIYLLSKGGIYNLNKNKSCKLEDIKKNKKPICLIDDDTYSLETITDQELKNLRTSISIIPFPPIFSIQSLESYQNILGFFGKRVYGLTDSNTALKQEIFDLNNKAIFLPLKGYIFDYNLKLIVDNKLSDNIHVSNFVDMVYITYYSSTGEIAGTYFKVLEGEDMYNRTAEELSTFIEVNIPKEVLDSNTFGIIFNNKKLFNSTPIKTLIQTLKTKFFLNIFNKDFFTLKVIDRLKYIDMDTLLLRLTQTQVTNYFKIMSFLLLISIALYGYKFYYSTVNNGLRDSIKNLENKILNLAQENQKFVLKNKILFLRNFINKDLNKIVSVLLSNNIFDVTGYKLYGYEYSTPDKIIVFYKREPTYSTYIESEFIEKIKELLQGYEIVDHINGSIVLMKEDRLVEFIITLKNI
jgi:hypothetical protein